MHGALLLAMCAVTGGSASAQSYELPYDPTSPAGAEYALPLHAARDHEERRRGSKPGGTGGSGPTSPARSREGQVRSQRFGAGVSPAKPRSERAPVDIDMPAREQKQADQGLASVVASADGRRLEIAGATAGGVLALLGVVLLALRLGRGRQH